MATRPDTDVQEATATARFIRMSPRKARQVVDLIRGRHVDDARRVLRYAGRAASGPVTKVLESAVANAEHNRGLPADELVVSRAWVDEGPTLKRFRPRALGRATRIRKRTSHISVVVGRVEAAAQAPAREAERSTSRTRRRRTGDAAPSQQETRARRKTTSTTKASAGKAAKGKSGDASGSVSAKKKTTRKRTQES